MDDLPAGQELVEDKLRALTDALGDLKIVGVRPRPPGLKNLDQEDLKLTQIGRAVAPEQGILPDAAGALLGPGGRAGLDRRGGRLHPALRRAHFRRRR